MSSPSGETAGLDGPARRTDAAAALAPDAGVTARILGLDLARFVAIIGMIATHTWLYADFTSGEVIAGSQLFDGRASALFAVLAGVGIVLSTRSAVAAGRFGSARLMVFGRGTALVVIGLTLDLVDVRVLVILVYYGVMFWLIAPLVTVPTWVLGVLTGVVAVVGPVLAWLVALWAAGMSASSFGGFGASVSGNVNWVSLWNSPLAVLREVLFTGSYPAVIWLAYGLAGVLVGRAVVGIRSLSSLRATGRSIALAGGAVWLVGIVVSAVALGPLDAGAGVAADARIPSSQGLGLLLAGGSGHPSASSLWYLLTPAAHTGSTVDLLLTGGFGVTAIGVLMLLGSVLGPGVQRVLAPVIGAGRAPLTVYTAHVLLVAVAVGVLSPVRWSSLTYEQFVAVGTPWYISSVWMFLLNVLLALVIGAVVMVVGRRGPLEAVVTWAGRVFGRGVARVER